MKESISPQERRLLATIIMAGLYSNSRHIHTYGHLVTAAVDLLDKLLVALNKPDKV